MAPPEAGHLLRRGYRLIAHHVSLHPRPFVTAVLGAAIYAMATVASSYVLGQVVDSVIVPRFEGDDVDIAALVLAALAIVGVGLVRAGGVVMRRVNAGRFNYRVSATLRCQVIEQYQRQPLAYHRANSTGELIAHAGVDVDTATDALSPLPFASGVVLLVVVAGTWLVISDPLLGTVALLLLPLLGLVNVVYERRVEGPSAQAQRHLGEVSAVAHESLEGALVVKTLGAEASESRRFEARATDLRDAKIEVATLRANFETMLDLLPALANICLIVIGAWRVDAGAVSTGELVSFVNLFTLMSWPLRMIGYVLGEIPKSVAGYDRVRGVLDDAAPAVPAPARVADIALELCDVSYAYERGRTVLDGVNMRVPLGCTTALVGATGSGKSTLLMLAGGLLAPDQGSVAVGGSIAFVFQEPFLFADTVADNILLGADADDDDDLPWAAALAQADGFIERLPNGYATTVGERGATLSGGQRQRVALARALVRRPSLLLLDDATSSVDATTEARILTGLGRELAGTTTLVVANRPSTIALADEVAFLERGRVVDQGPHEELLQRQPRYRRLVEAYERERATR